MTQSSVPYRWALVGPDQIGSLLAGTKEPKLWFLPELIEATGKVLARSGNGDLYFVGRSLDSMFDLLGGAFADLAQRPKLRRLPFSFPRRERISPAQRARAREVCAELGLDPYALVRRQRPVTFVDVVYVGDSFTQLFTLLADWLDEWREPWNVARRKLRFVGITIRGDDNYRWQQHRAWPARLPADSVRNVPMAWPEWDYFGNAQPKLTHSFRVERWLDEQPGPDHGEKTRQALAEATALARAGRDAAGRRAIARAIRGEPALALCRRRPPAGRPPPPAWLRAIVRGLNGRGPPPVVLTTLRVPDPSALVTELTGGKWGIARSHRALSTRQRLTDPGTLRIPVKNVQNTRRTPVTQQAAEAQDGAAPARRVLVAEDEALIRLDLVEMLREEGYEVVGEAGDGEQAVQLAEELKPDLVILDIKMPRQDGIEAASQIAAKRIAPVVMLTAFSQRDLVEQARDAGAMAYLVKPFSKRDLVPAVELAISRFTELAALENEVAGLTERLETRKVVERAKGLLMAKQGMSEPDAFRWIQRTAMDRRTTMKAVADVVVENFG